MAAQCLHACAFIQTGAISPAGALRARIAAAFLETTLRLDERRPRGTPRPPRAAPATSADSADNPGGSFRHKQGQKSLPPRRSASLIAAKGGAVRQQVSGPRSARSRPRASINVDRIPSSSERAEQSRRRRRRCPSARSSVFLKTKLAARLS
jgi:hypothetical protein